MNWVYGGCAVLAVGAAWSIAGSLNSMSAAFTALIAAMSEQYQEDVGKIARDN